MKQEEKLHDLAKIASDSMLHGTAIQSHHFDIPSIEEVSDLLPQFDRFDYCGRGGMGIVYQCRQKELDRKIAVKILPASLSKDLIFKLRFDKEAKIIAGLSHPSIIRIYDFGITNGLTWFSMEYITGGTLAEKISDFAQSPSKTLKIIREICSAIDFAHGKGILHRDLKPINILLTDDDQGTSAIITDFGLAYSSSPQNTQLTVTGFNIANNHYSAPELQDSTSISDASEASDLYAIGAITYQMLTTEKPIGAFPYPSECTDYPAEVDRVIRKALSPNPQKRHSSAMDFFNELDLAIHTTQSTETTHSHSEHQQRTTQSFTSYSNSSIAIWSFFGLGILFTLFLSVFLSSGGNNFNLVQGATQKQFDNALGLVVAAFVMHALWISVSIFLWKKLKHLENCPSKKLLTSVIAGVCSCNLFMILLAVLD